MVRLTHWTTVYPEEAARIRVTRRSYPRLETTPHCHDFTELAIILGGSGRHVVDDHAYPFSAGDVFVLQGQHAHCYREVCDLDIVEIQLHPGTAALLEDELRMLPGYHALFVLEPQCRRQHRFQSRLQLDDGAMGQLTELLVPLLQEYAERRPGYQATLMGGYMQLVVYLSRCYSQTDHPPSRALLQLGEAISRLDRQYQESITVPELAATAHLSVNQFLRVFKRATQMSPVAYLLQVRLRKAAELLAATDFSVTEVAFRVGFSDSNYFSRQFKLKYGMAPRAYRSRVPDN
ncbi:MAG TPA: helix-turn-helix domain-containing protein [Armatimonadota bacterium]|jgi:AraC family L-rhamnose operon transcriptional activator RhaR/AraC family L-rhamnose operon regulatory protein RhaS